MIDGQKVWSSYAADAEFGLLLARTDPDAAKPQLGITMFILPMTPGVTVRPLVDIAGGRHFNEVFLEGVRLGADAVLGDVNSVGVSRRARSAASGPGTWADQAAAGATGSCSSAADVAGRRGDAVVRQRLAASSARNGSSSGLATATSRACSPGATRRPDR